MTIEREDVQGGERPGYKAACMTCPQVGGLPYYLGDSATRLIEENGYAEWLAVRHDDIYQHKHTVVIYHYSGSPTAE